MSLPINHRVLHVDLTERSVWTEQPDETFYRRFVGGRGMIAHQLLTAVPPDADPLGPENQLVFALGPLTGIAFPGNARFSVGAKSPLTGLYGEAEAGGFWPAELKRAGWDGIVVEGRATGPVYVWIHDDQVEIRDARHLWGKITGDAEDAIRAELGERRARIAQIGPAGENLVRYACIMNDLNEAAGRTGLGAVMGSKRLKAIAVRGTQVVQPVAGTLFKETARQVAANLSSDYLSLHTYGTGVALEAGKHREGHLIVHNFRDGRMETVRNIDANAIHDNVLEKMDACYACSVRCKKRVRIENGASVDPRYGGPEYEAIGALGSNLAVDDLVALCKSNELCNAYGLDAISTGGAIGWAMELYEVGLLTDEDTGGEPLRWGSGEDVLRLVDQIT
ncbi:MAG: aldehyde ferredoxin oxidoreductase, partial [Dehalococcoidia bacterium]|nr:aldehyde ferredoxin oxidoreductase [Dehalococcoidia bacterium]